MEIKCGLTTCPRKSAEPRRQGSRFLGSSVSEPPDRVSLLQSNKCSVFSQEGRGSIISIKFSDSWGGAGAGHPTPMSTAEGLGPHPSPFRGHTPGEQKAACKKHPGRLLAATQNFMKSLKPTRQNRPGQRVQPKTCCLFTSSSTAQCKVNQIIELHKQRPREDYVNTAGVWWPSGLP